MPASEGKRRAGLCNLTPSDPVSGKTYGYNVENKLTSVVDGGGTQTLTYDPLNRLDRYNPGGAPARFLYDGVDAVSEYDNAGAVLRRYVFDPTTGQPLVWFEGGGTAAPRYLSSDERGSIISATDASGNLIGLNTYDEYGRPGAANIGRYEYTGQKWLGEAALYDYKARDYLPHLGIFAQPDPVAYADSPNLYAYVLDDPVNLIDPFGMKCWNVGGSPWICSEPEPMGFGGAFGGMGSAAGLGSERGGARFEGDRPQNNEENRRQACNTFRQTARARADTNAAAVVADLAEGVGTAADTVAGIAVFVPGAQGVAVYAKGVGFASRGVEFAANTYIGWQTGNWSGVMSQGISALTGLGFGGASRSLALRLGGVPGRMGPIARESRAKAFGNAAGNVAGDAAANNGFCAR